MNTTTKKPIVIDMKDEIFSSRMFDMKGLEIDKKTHEIISHGQIFYGADFIVKYENGTYKLIIQTVRNGEATKSIDLKGKTDRSIRIETNKMFPRFKWRKPAIISISRYMEKLNEQNGVY